MARGRLGATYIVKRDTPEQKSDETIRLEALKKERENTKTAPGAAVLPATRDGIFASDLRDTKVISPSDKILTTMEIRGQIAQIMNTRDYHPIRELVDIVQKKWTNPDTGKLEFYYDAEFRKSIHVELAPYIAPKLRALDLAVGGVGGMGAINITINKYSDGAKPVEKQATRHIDI